MQSSSATNKSFSRGSLRKKRENCYLLPHSLLRSCTRGWYKNKIRGQTKSLATWNILQTTTLETGQTIVNLWFPIESIFNESTMIVPFPPLSIAFRKDILLHQSTESMKFSQIFVLMASTQKIGSQFSPHKIQDKQLWLLSIQTIQCSPWYENHSQTPAKIENFLQTIDNLSFEDTTESFKGHKPSPYYVRSQIKPNPNCQTKVVAQNTSSRPARYVLVRGPS